jgi:hypothetical protein
MADIEGDFTLDSPIGPIKFKFGGRPSAAPSAGQEVMLLSNLTPEQIIRLAPLMTERDTLLSRLKEISDQIDIIRLGGV